MIYSQTTPIVQLVQEDIDFIQQIPILDNEDSTYITDIENIDYIRESYGLSLIDSISLLENVNEISNLSLSIPDWYVYSNPDILTESIQYTMYSTQDDEEDKRLQYIIENYDNWEDIILEGINISSKKTGKEAEQNNTQGDNKKEIPSKDKGSKLDWVKKHKWSLGGAAVGAGLIGGTANTIRELRNHPRVTNQLGRTFDSLPTNKVSEQIFRLRRKYSQFLAKANESVDKGKASFFKKQATRVLDLIDRILAKAGKATNKVGDAAWSIRKKFK